MRIASLLGLLLVTMSYGPLAAAQHVGATVTIDSAEHSDQYAAGRIIRVNAPIAGDLVVAGQRIIVAGDIGGDLIAAGESVDVRQAVADDVRAAGRTVSINAPVAGHIVAAGETVTLDRAADVAQWAWLAGRTIVVEGSIGEDLKAAGESVSLGGRVEGDANLIGQRIAIGPAAFIGGDLIVQSRAEPDIAAGATIVGEIIREDLPDDERGFGPVRWISGTAGFVYFTVTLLTAVLLLAWAFPTFAAATSKRLAAMPLRALGTGLLAVIGIPVLTVLAFMTGIGLIVGFGLLGAYLLLLLLGMLLGIVALGHVGLQRLSGTSAPQRATTLLAMAIATVAVLVVAQIPVLGSLVLLLLMLAGLGALSSELLTRYRQAA